MSYVVILGSDDRFELDYNIVLQKYHQERQRKHIDFKVEHNQAECLGKKHTQINQCNLLMT
jgi:hypothetical protein